MTNNIEKTDKVDSVHLILAVRRSKENEGQTHKDELCFREIVRGSTEETVAKIKARISAMPGVWRIYHTVNARDTRKATKLLMHELLDHFEEQHYRIDSLYKKCLLQTTCRATKYFMLDIDTENETILNTVYQNIIAPNPWNINLGKHHKTPSGYHIMVHPFNLNDIKLPEHVTLIKDGYYFLERVEIK